MQPPRHKDRDRWPAWDTPEGPAGGASVPLGVRKKAGWMTPGKAVLGDH